MQFETYVKSLNSKTKGGNLMTVFLLESYVKSLTSKTEGMLLYVFIMFETYVKYLQTLIGNVAAVLAV